MSCMWMLQRGHSGDGCVLALALCKYDLRKGNLFVLSWAKVRRVMLQTTQPSSGGDVTADSSCCANCVEPPRPQQWGPDLPFWGMPAMRTRWMGGAAAHKSG